MKELIIIALGFFLLMSCHKDDDADLVFNSDNICFGGGILVDRALYNRGSNDTYSLIKAELTDDCLSLVVNHQAGCGGLMLQLVADKVNTTQYPTHVYLKLLITNFNPCRRGIEWNYSFNLSSLRKVGGPKIILHISGLNQSIKY